MDETTETVLRAHEINQRNWAFDVAQLPEFAGKDRETERREALIAELDAMDAAQRARNAAAAQERAKVEAAEQLSAIASRKADLAAEIAALDAEAARLAAVAEPAPKKPKAKE